MPSLNDKFLLKLKDNIKDYQTFIETGTYKGATIFAIEEYFNKILTIEVKKELYDNLISKYKGDKIKFIYGDSVEVFEYIFKYINENTIFFLDGHLSANDSGFKNKTVPLLEEIELINKNFKNKGIIIINDVRLFGKKIGSEDWSDISKDKIFEILFNRITDFYYVESELDPQDRLVIHIKDI